MTETKAASTVEEALAELREMFPNSYVAIECGLTAPEGNPIYYVHALAARIAVESTLEKCMERVRACAWKESTK